MRQFAFFLVASFVAVHPSAAGPRQRLPAGGGSAVELKYSVQPETLRPGSDATLLLCLSNVNPSSSRDIAPGDEFSFTFAGGDVHSCGELTVHSPDGSLEGAFQCVVDGRSVTLRFTGSAVPWKFGDAACVQVGYTAADAPTPVTATMDVENQGAFLAAAPPMLLLGVDTSSGSTGPVPAWTFVTSNDKAFAIEGEPPVPVPGLDATITTEGGSSLEVHVDTLAGVVDCTWPHGHLRPEGTLLLLELDGAVVASRLMLVGVTFPAPAGFPINIHWASPPIGPGSHRVRVLVDMLPLPGDYYSACIGSADNDHFQARMLVKELPPSP